VSHLSLTMTPAQARFNPENPRIKSSGILRNEENMTVTTKELTRLQIRRGKEDFELRMENYWDSIAQAFAPGEWRDPVVALQREILFRVIPSIWVRNLPTVHEDPFAELFGVDELTAEEMVHFRQFIAYGAGAKGGQDGTQWFHRLAARTPLQFLRGKVFVAGKSNCILKTEAQVDISCIPPLVLKAAMRENEMLNLPAMNFTGDPEALFEARSPNEWSKFCRLMETAKVIFEKTEPQRLEFTFRDLAPHLRR